MKSKTRKIAGLILISLVLLIAIDANLIKATEPVEPTDCETYCKYDGLGCLLTYSNGVVVHCLERWSKQYED